MATLRLDQRRVDALKPRKSAYDVRDRDLKGFGVRVLTSGAKRYFIHSQHNGRRFWKIVGQAGAIGPDEARSQARTLLAVIRNGSGDETAAPADVAFETVAEEVFRRYARNWKPSTLKVNRGYYKNQILPWFEGRLHDCRHTYASMALAQGETVLTIVRLLGHRNPATTLKYTHLSDAMVRSEAEIEDVRLHDLRHTYASHAVLQGVPLPVVSRLLGHKNPGMTLRYANVGDRETEAAAERIGVAIARALDGGGAGNGG